MNPASDEDFMRLALAQARLGVGLTSPNPPVGAVLVKEGAVIAAGHHRKAGGPHAEIAALRDAAERGVDGSGATAYVTLEPCSTHGRTGACTNALISAGVARVVYGAVDPNPDHAGGADAVLHKAGIAVTGGVLRPECVDLLRPFTKRITTGLPYVIAKAGQSLDGRLTRPPGEPQWITSEASRAHAMQLRVRCDAVMVGAETLRKDNPKLTLRGEGVPADKLQPWRIIVTRSGDVPRDAAVFTDDSKDRTVVLQGERSFDDILRELADRGITSVLVEGGGNLMAQAFAARAVDEVCWYVAPIICGGGTLSVGGVDFAPGAASVALDEVSHEIIGDNLCIRGYPVWNS
jgi:diaminohydroxyphosphoribosylaminopyrimidine deaminase / 5-amino-6-(5-phosphoribosylamino)uracil reductase